MKWPWTAKIDEQAKEGEEVALMTRML